VQLIAPEVIRYEPARQLKHSRDPATEEPPASHMAQFEEPDSDCADPAAQFVQPIAPVIDEYMPAAQLTQLVTELEPVEGENLPAEQSMQILTRIVSSLST